MTPREELLATQTELAITVRHAEVARLARDQAVVRALESGMTSDDVAAILRISQPSVIQIHNRTRPGRTKRNQEPLTRQQRGEIELALAGGVSQASLARKYGVSPSTIWRIRHDR